MDFIFNFGYIYQQPLPTENFCYDSLIKKKKTLECEYVLCTANTADTQIVYIVIDVYAQVEPQRLAPYSIKQNDNLDLTFIVDRMERVSPGYYKYKLENCHIRKESNKSKYKSIKNKLKDLHIWRHGQNITSKDLDIIDNTVSTDYDNMPLEDKVYIGFTPYIYDFHTGCKVAMDATTFTQPIYHTSPSLIQPNFGYVAGGSTHLIKLPKSVSVPTRPILLQLTTVDSSWRICMYGEPCPSGLRFILPSLEEVWQDSKEIRLFYLEFMEETAHLPKGPFKFIYIKER